MKQLFFRLRAYIVYWFYSLGANRIHSPFVFNLYIDAIASDHQFYWFEKFGDLREENLSDERKFPVLATGASEPTGNVSISEISRRSVAPEKYQRLLFRLVVHFKPKTILELGTSLGLTTLYLAAPDSQASVVTLEGNPGLIPVAKENAAKVGIQNIRFVQGLFNKTLPDVLAEFDRLDFVFLDGDHREESTLEYVKAMLPKFHEHSVLVMDDIHWNAGMDSAWEAVQQLPEVTVTIDLFRMGLVFFRKGQEKQHFRLNF